MILWLVILFSCGIAFIGFKKGLYVMFASLFNQLFAVFGAVLSTPKLLSVSPGLEHSEYHAAGVLLLLYLFIFGLLQFLAWFYFLRDREDYFPVLFDKIGATVLGFLCGYLISCMVLLVLCIGLTPLDRAEKLDWSAMRQKLEPVSVPGLVKACDFLAWYSLECFDGNSQASLDYLLHLNDQEQEQEPKTPSMLIPENQTDPDILVPDPE